MQLLTRLDLYNIARRHLIANAKNIDPAVVDVAGSDANIFCGAVSWMADAVVKFHIEGARNLTLDADREELDRTVIDRYTLPRKGASAAVGRVRMFRSSAVAGAGQVPIGTQITALGGAEYVTLTAASFGASQIDNVLADVRAVQAGFSFQVGRNQIRNFSNAGALFDPSIQVTNDEPTAGGSNRESDAVYRNRARRFWAAARRGTLSAIIQGALEVEGVDSANAVEVLGGDGEPARMVELSIADLAGVANSVLAARVKAALMEYRAGGISVRILTSQPQIIDVALHLTFIADVDTSTLSNDIRFAVVEFVNSLGANEPLLRDDLSAVLTRFRSDGLVPLASSIAVPTGDIIPAAGRTLRTRFENVTLV